MEADWLIENVHLATMRCRDDAPYGAVDDGLLAVSEGRISWAGPRREAPRFEAGERIDGNGGWVTPGLIDCHTHLIHAGERTREFEMRQQGRTVAEIARCGGGINRTVAATREASDEKLLRGALARLRALHVEGVTTVEIKSGYGLDFETELRMLRIAAELARSLPVRVCPTYLGAHVVPNEYAGRANDYVDYVCERVMPRVAALELATAVDIFCDEIAFTVAQCRQVLNTARRLGLPVKGHVEQLSHSGGARLLAEFEALSADHLEYLDEADIPWLREHNVVAVLLPGAYHFLGGARKPPVEALRAAGVRMAVATDCNPGSSPLASLLTAMNLACVLFGLSPEEALRGVTADAARALGLHYSRGRLAPGLDADLALWEIDHPAALSCTLNLHHPARTWSRGIDAAAA